LAVSDRGPGIAPEEQARVFEKFYRVPTGLVHDVQGSGLGLAIVKHVVEAHGGSVELSSTPGVGSTFRIRLPVHAG
jgi:signal transduction histidine kinase